VAPSPPTDLRVTAGAADPAIADLAWNPPAGEDSVTYRIYRSEADDGPWILCGETDALHYTFTDGLGGVGYYFRVTAINDNDEESTPAQGGPASASWLGSPHTSVTSTSATCAKCHAMHEAQSALLMRHGNQGGEPAAQIATCYACHSGRSATAANIASGTTDSFALPSGHKLGEDGESGLTEACLSCHGMHENATTAPMLPSDTVNGRDVQGVGPNWCYACHDASNSWYEAHIRCLVSVA
jgi:hypothetical protein